MHVLLRWGAIAPLSLLLAFPLAFGAIVPLCKPAVAQTQDSRKTEADKLFQQGKQQYQTSQFQGALQSFQQALELYREIGDRSREGVTLNNIGVVYQSLGQYPKALETFQQALSIHHEVGNRPMEGTTLNNIGDVYRALGQYPKALETLEQALVIAREVGNRFGEGTTLNNIGLVYAASGQYPKALEMYQQALVIHREVGNRLMEGTTLNNIGLVYEVLGQYPKVLEMYQQALVIFREVGARTNEGGTLNNIGAVYDSLGQYPKALATYQQALVILRGVGDLAGEGTTLNNIGAVYQVLGQYPKALATYQQALMIHRKVGNRPMEGTTLNNIGAVYRALGQSPKALDTYQQVLVILREVGARANEGVTLGNIGAVYQALGQSPKSLEMYRQALAIAREVGNRSEEGKTLGNIGAVFFQTKQFAKAEESLLKELVILQALRDSKLSDSDRISLFETQVVQYSGLQQILIAQNKPDKTLQALEVSEQGRARSMVEELSSRYLPASGKAGAEAPNLAAIRQVAQQQNVTLVQYSLIDLNIGTPSLYIWVVKPTGDVTFKAVNLKTLNRPLAELVSMSRQAIGARNRDDGTIVVRLTDDEQKRRQAEETRNLQQLYQLLIQPIEQELPKDESDKVVFVPQGELFLVPFAALMDANGKYLIEKHTLVTSPSIQVLALTRRMRESGVGSRESGRQLQAMQPNQVLVVGNPTMPKIWNAETSKEDKSLPSLPGSEQEAIAIANALKTKPLIGKQATKAVIVPRMETARIIHLATHGLLEYGDPKLSGVRDVPGAIALAPAGSDSGLLTAAEILQLKLNADLVVLSACDTGRGDIKGDGVIGLSRSFITAGVPSVMVSLWSVDDAATSELMQTFYSLWQSSKQPMPKAQALRQAMLLTMKQHPEPRLWAAFTLIGESE